jgi:hypothetical protein
MAKSAQERALAELKDEQDRKRMEEAYNKSASRSMGTFKEKTPKPPALPPKTEARKKAEFMEKMRMSPAVTKEAQSEGMKGPRMMKAPAQIYDAVRSVVSPRTPRTEEEMDELTREVARGMKKGGMVKSSASKRADGCAQRGNTKGRMV